MNHSPRKLFLLLTALMLSVFLIGCGSGAGSQGDGSTSLPGEAVSAREERLTYPGFTSRVLDWDNRTLTLPNDEKNTADLIFTITDSDGNVLYTSERVAPGEHEEWDAVSSGLSSGKQKITITMAAVVGEGEALNTASQTITVKIPSAED